MRTGTVARCFCATFKVLTYFGNRWCPPRRHKSIVVLTLALNTTNFFLRLMENFTLLDQHITTLSSKWKKILSSQIGHKESAPECFPFFSRTRKRQIGCKESAPVCFLQCFTFFNVPIKWGCNILLV